MLLPLALVLAELRMRPAGVWSLLVVALCYHVVPRLFIDPRDAIAQGIPALQHVASWIGVLIGTAAVAVGLWLIRRTGSERSGRTRLRVTAVAAVVLCAAWMVFYLVLGEPGFANDGLLVVMETQADLSGAYAISDREARLQYVYATLVDTAERTQGPVRADLERRAIPYRPYTSSIWCAWTGTAG